MVARGDRRLSEIWDYYVQVAGPHTAQKILRDIVGLIALVETHPPAGRDRDEVRLGLRSLAVSPHIVFYRIVDDVPQIVRALDGR